MKRVVLFLLLALFLAMPLPAVAAQATPVSVPEATAETANVGETGPRFETGGQSYSIDEFVSIVVQDSSHLWATLFGVWGRPFVPPLVVTVEAGSYARSSCGINTGDPQENPILTPALYCQYGGELGTQDMETSTVYENEFSYEPVIYLSLPWLESYALASGAPADVAVAYRVVHEYVHHIEQLLGYIDHTGGGCCGYSDQQIELMAECLTGVWAYSAYDKGQLREVNVAASQKAAWDDPAEYPEEFGRENQYGTAEQRMKSFMTGYEEGNPGRCFAAMPGP